MQTWFLKQADVLVQATIVVNEAMHRLRKARKLPVAETSRRGHATRLAQDAAASNIDVVVVLGGDGTLNEAANGVVGSDTALAILPGERS